MVDVAKWSTHLIVSQATAGSSPVVHPKYKPNYSLNDPIFPQQG